MRRDRAVVCVSDAVQVHGHGPVEPELRVDVELSRARQFGLGLAAPSVAVLVVGSAVGRQGVYCRGQQALAVVLQQVELHAGRPTGRLLDVAVARRAAVGLRWRARVQIRVDGIGDPGHIHIELDKPTQQVPRRLT